MASGLRFEAGGVIEQAAFIRIKILASGLCFNAGPDPTAFGLRTGAWGLGSWIFGLGAGVWDLGVSDLWSWGLVFGV